MHRLDLRLFNINYAVFTDVAAACRHLQTAFHIRPHTASGVRRCLMLKKPGDSNRKYTLWFEDVCQHEFELRDDAIRWLEHSLLQRATQENFGITIFHSAWIARKQNALLLTGGSGVGKTSISYELVKRGFRLGSDEAAAFQNQTGFLLPFYRNFLFKPTVLQSSERNFTQYSLTGDDRCYRSPPGSPPAWAHSGPYRLHFIFPCYIGGPAGSPWVKRLDTSEALQRLAQNCFNLRYLDQSLLRRLVNRLDPATAFEVHYSSITEAADMIEQIGSEK